MDDKKLFIIANTIKTSVSWIAGCSLIKYAIGKTGRLAPLLAILVLPKYAISLDINKHEKEEEENGREDESESDEFDDSEMEE